MGWHIMNARPLNIWLLQKCYYKWQLKKCLDLDVIYFILFWKMEKQIPRNHKIFKFFFIFWKRFTKSWNFATKKTLILGNLDQNLQLTAG